MANKEGKNKKHFFKDFKAELKKVIWPTPKQLVNSTIAVVVIVLVTAAIVFVLDLAFELFGTHGINKIRSGLKNENTVVVQDSNVVNTETNEVANNTVVENEVQE